MPSDEITPLLKEVLEMKSVMAQMTEEIKFLKQMLFMLVVAIAVSAVFTLF